MIHEKIYSSKQLKTENETMLVEGPLMSNELSNYHFHPDLVAFRPAPKQFEALKEIAELPEGRIYVARTEDTIVGYVTFLHPDPLERWSTFNMEELIELGAIEIAPDYRGYQLGSTLLEIAVADSNMEHYIIISTEYYWHWDLKGTQLSIWNYRKIMEKMMSAGGLKPAPTDDPEIMAHPANCLMVRIGKHVSEASIQKFQRLRFLSRSTS
ncbi:GNAT family N-acetyltransferase [Radiobacillus kanasensis]|uniref:GNAT family N-acetyltransferase n=1 Tax=Radiobacillus kanasensis TaxID=2844358 RepID=UPI001E4E57C5|nr:GNAT family N-acetyltransferase [Radiobacillus kanasensis]UFT98056.1 GNAT family N-acetyltransferase [Radiobacillus kanasensis]